MSSLFLILCAQAALISSSYSYDITTKDMHMPGVSPTKDDHYLCTSSPVGAAERFIVEFEPVAEMNTAHHMLLFGCSELAITNQPWWECESTYTICKRNMKILYAWARNAPAKEMPKDVGFKIGRGSGIQYLVLQVHYAKKFTDSHKDYSGMIMSLTSAPQRYIAGVWLMAANSAYIKAHTKKTHVDVSCRYGLSVPIHAFARRVHAHALATVISGYVLHKGEKDWDPLGKGNPQWPQAFYPLDNEVTISKGDIVYARCTYDSSHKDIPTFLGSTANDEMCNLYIMYYTDAEHGSAYGECSDNEFDQLEDMLPADNDAPLPHNELLEEATDMKPPSTSSPLAGPEKMGNVLPTSSYKDNSLHLKEDPTWQPRITLGDVGGVSVSKTGEVYVFHRSSRHWVGDTFDRHNVYQHQRDGAIDVDVVLKLDEDSGEVLSSWGKGRFYLPHGIHVDPDDNVWVTDVALHQVFKFPPAGGDPILTFGTRFQPGSDLNHLCQPTSVAVARTGEVFIADGYCNSRVLKYSTDGKLLDQWNIVPPSNTNKGGSVMSRKMLMYHIPHSITIIDSNVNGGQQVVCIADRENGLVSCFDFNGEYLAHFGTLAGAERLFAIAYSKSYGGLLHGVTGPSIESPKSSLVTGFTISLTNMSVVDVWAPDHIKSQPFSTPHTLAVSPSGHDVYVGEVEIGVGGHGVRKFTNSPVNINPETLGKRVYSGDQATKVEDVKVKDKQVDLDNNGEEELSEKMSDKSDGDSSMKTSLIIASLLAVPVLIIVLIAACIRLRRSHTSYGSLNMTDWMNNKFKPTQDKFNIGGLLSRHRGFDRVSTEESDHDLQLESDSDVDEYVALPNGQASNHV